MTKSLTYLDHAAATPVDPVVLEAMLPYFSEKFFNPSSPYSPAVEVKREYGEAKRRLALVLGVQADELVMTAGATESINIAFTAASGLVAVGAVEHASVIAAAKRAGCVTIAADKRGRVSGELVRKALTPEVTFVSVGMVSSELGTVQPIEEMGRVIESERQRRLESGEDTPLLFHCDASQALTLIDVKPKRLGVDLLTLSAAKIYGPKQVGLLWVRPGVVVKPTVVGGGQEMGLRSGTENVAGVIGFTVAAELAAKRRSTEIKRLRELRDDMLSVLVGEFPDMVISSDIKRGLVNFLNISFPGVDAERLVFLLESQGVMVATGSACAANKGRRSHILQAIGLSDSEIDGSLRISLGRLSSKENCQEAAEAIVAAVRSEKARTRQ